MQTIIGWVAKPKDKSAFVCEGKKVKVWKKYRNLKKAMALRQIQRFVAHAVYEGDIVCPTMILRKF